MAQPKTIIVYLRLSCEDLQIKDSYHAESHSISNQRSIIQAYINDSAELKGCKTIELVDDGYSGVSFERPSIIKALAMLRGKEAQCLIVKDLSRFGRSYIDVCNYLERVFPLLGIRFISVNDGYDSDDCASVGSMTTVFKAMLADLYSKDLSVKVKSALYHKAKQGKFLSASAPYGYIKTVGALNTLIIDEEAANIIRYIFCAFVGGANKNELARELNRQGIPTPMQYKKGLGYTQGWERMVKGDKPLWTGYTISKILQDCRYIGTVVYGKREKPYFHQKRQVTTQKEAWVVAEDMHESIISKEMFHNAQALLGTRQTDTAQTVKAPLPIKSECAICGKALTLVRACEPYYYCKTRQYTDEFACKRLHLKLSAVSAAVLSAIKSQAALAVNIEQLLLLQSKKHQAAIHAKQAEIKRCKSEVSRWEARQKALLQALFDKKIDIAAFQEEGAVIAAKRTSLAQQAKALTVELNSSYAAAKQPHTLIEELNEEVANGLIYSIKVYDSDTIEVFCKFSDELNALPIF